MFCSGALPCAINKIMCLYYIYVTFYECYCFNDFYKKVFDKYKISYYNFDTSNFAINNITYIHSIALILKAMYQLNSNSKSLKNLKSN